jgi:hypothetical protein
MILENFKNGWKKEFEPKLQMLSGLFPDITLVSAVRYHGMLKIVLSALDKDIQYVVDCVTHKIERQSVNTCEECGKHGIRRDAYLVEKMCLCWQCYVLEVDSIQQNTKTKE